MRSQDRISNQGGEPLPMSRRTLLSLALGMGGILALSACGGASGTATGSGESGTGDSGAGSPGDGAASGSGVLTAPLDNGYGSGTHHAKIEVEGFGSIELELNANAAPVTVSNFADLAGAGFYDGLTFHRVISGFMIQGGDPKGDGTGGSDRRIKGEFSANGVVNPIMHKRGVISMARSSDYDSASSQFFIVHEDAGSLDGQYAAFGKVTDGMDVVDAIAQKTPVQDSNGSVAAADQPRITRISMVD